MKQTLKKSINYKQNDDFASPPESDSWAGPAAGVTIKKLKS